jgi:hypothetical protein
MVANCSNNGTSRPIGNTSELQKPAGQRSIGKKSLFGLISFQKQMEAICEKNAEFQQLKQAEHIACHETYLRD